MPIDKLVALAVIAALMCTVLRASRPEFALAVTLVAGTLFTASYIAGLSEVVRTIAGTGADAGIADESVNALLKVLGISLLGEFGAGICRDAGESALAGKVELGARVIMLVNALPIVKRLVEAVTSLCV